MVGGDFPECLADGLAVSSDVLFSFGSSVFFLVSCDELSFHRCWLSLCCHRSLTGCVS